LPESFLPTNFHGGVSMKVSVGRIGDKGLDAILDRQEVFEKINDDRTRREYIKDHFYHGTKRLKGVVLKSSKKK
jgi:hypothetical protein